MSLAVSNRDGGKTSERGIYDALGAHLSGEIISGFRVRPADPVSMNVRIGGEYDSATGVGRDSALIRDGLRTYDVFIDDGVAVTATVSAAHASLARIDTVVLYIDKSVARTKTLVDNTNGVVKAKVVAGTPNSAPVAPDNTAIQSSVSSGNPFIKLGNINVAAGATNILSGNIVDVRSFARLYMPGAIAGNLSTDASGNVTAAPNSAATLRYSTYGTSGGQVVSSTTATLAFDELHGNGNTVVTKNADGIIKVGAAGYYDLTLNLTKADGDNAANIRMWIAYSTDNGSTWNKATGEGMNTVTPISNGFSLAPRIALGVYLPANSLVRSDVVTSAAVRFGADNANTKSQSGLSVRRVG